MSDPVTHNIAWHPGHLTDEERFRYLGQRGAVVWLTGPSGSGKSTVAHALERALVERGVFALVLDAGNVRGGLCGDLGGSAADRGESIRRSGEVARLLAAANVVVLTSFAAARRADRDRVRTLFPPGAFIEVHCAASVEACAARASGATTPDEGSWEPPLQPELVLDTVSHTVEDSVAQVLIYLADRDLAP